MKIKFQTFLITLSMFCLLTVISGCGGDDSYNPAIQSNNVPLTIEDASISVSLVDNSIKSAGRIWEPSETEVSKAIKTGISFSRFLGHNPRASGAGKSGINRAPVMKTNLPSKFSWRDKDGINWNTPVKNQGYYLTCIAFAAAAAVETQIRIKNQNPAQTIDLSELHFFYYGGGNFEQGWDFSTVFEYLKNQGTVSETDCPYSNAPGHNDSVCLSANKIKINDYVYFYGKDLMKSQLIDGPVITYMTIYQDFAYYKSGVYQHLTNFVDPYGQIVFNRNAGSHAISIVGYDEQLGCWYAKNSWGTGWGDTGYFSIKYDDCGIGSNEAFSVTPGDNVAPKPLAAVTGLVLVSATGSSLTVKWDAAAGAAGYYVFVDNTQVRSLSETLFEIINLSPDTSYSINITAFNQTGESPRAVSLNVRTAPAPVPGPNAKPLIANVTTGATAGLIPLTFDLSDSDNDVCSIKVYYSINNGQSYLQTVNLSGPTGGLTSGTFKLVYWRSDVDVKTNSNTVKIKIIANDGKEDGAAAESPTFIIWTTIGIPPDFIAPSVNSTVPSDNDSGVAVDVKPTVNFSEAMDPSTITAAVFTIMGPGAATVPGAVFYSGTTATFTPASLLAGDTTYTAIINTGAKDPAGNPLAADFVWNFTTGAPAAASPAPVSLGAAANFAVLAKSGISSVPPSSISGDIGVSPIAASAITGFSLTLDGLSQYSTSSQVNGKVYAADYAAPSPSNLTAAVSAMEAAYADAAGRSSGVTEAGAGNIGGLTLAPGVYKWSGGVTIPSDVTFSGGPDDVWIMQIAGGITLADGKKVILNGGAAAKNIFWQVSGVGALGKMSRFEGIILSQTAITVDNGAAVNGRLLAQTAVTLIANTVIQPGSTAPPPVVPPVTPPSAAPVDLGTASTFGCFGGCAGVTNQGTDTVIDGNIGTTGTSTMITGFHDAGGNIYTQTPLNTGTVNKTIYAAPPAPGTIDAFNVAAKVAADAQTAFNALSTTAFPGGTDPGSGQLGGLTLAPGVYKSGSGAFLITGADLTLDAKGDGNAVWVFQMASSLTVGDTAPRSVILANGAQAKNVFWRVGSAATINGAGGGTMAGTIIASAGVTFSTPGNAAKTTLNGRALALNASVTMVNTHINVPAQ